MPLQNRVSPEGAICFSAARGTLMGNRGCLHNGSKQIIAATKRDAWVTCALRYKNVRRPLMDAGKYTELFFLDEATALAAGHRPCATCRRDRYEAFMTAWSEGNRSGEKVLSGEVDQQLKQDRKPTNRKATTTLKGLPDGVMVKHVDSGAFYLMCRGQALPWSFEGYGRPISSTALSGRFIILTPECTINAIRAGYAVAIHESAAHQ